MTNKLKQIRWGLVIMVIWLAVMPGSGRAALDYYLSLPSLPGTSANFSHPDWTSVLNLHFGVSHPPGVSEPAFTSLSLDKYVDANSPLLAQLCASNGYLPSASLQVIRAVTQQAYQVKLDNVWLTSLTATNDPASGDILERVGLRFGKITWTYTQYEPNGINSTDITTAYDLLFGKVPVLLTVTGVQNPGSGTMDVTWNARAGATYNLLGSPQVDGTFTFIGTLTATNLGPATVTLPAPGDMYFYRLQEVP